MKLLQGKEIAGTIKEELKKEVEGMNNKPCLASICVGDNAGSGVYVKSQKKTAEVLGIEYRLLEMPGSTSQATLLAKVDELNNDSGVSGVIIQMPLPQGINAKEVINRIHPLKDAEGMHPQNLGNLLLAKEEIVPCTAQASMMLIESTGEKLYGKEAVVVGHSEIVGKPMSLLLLNRFVTVSVCHIATGERGDVPDFVKDAEVLIVAVGKAGLIKGEWVKEGAIVIDVGINRVGDKLVGDVTFEEASKRASYITPVPGGVGPLTVTMLMRNVVRSHKLQGKA
jgi:methylenetetrahydrofolate dehydrogenase (NADP+)/methenyltetrahydrofolate cyclohydrolase